MSRFSQWDAQQDDYPLYDTSYLEETEWLDDDTDDIYFDEPCPDYPDWPDEDDENNEVKTYVDEDGKERYA